MSMNSGPKRVQNIIAMFSSSLRVPHKLCLCIQTLMLACQKKKHIGPIGRARGRRNAEQYWGTEELSVNVGNGEWEKEGKEGKDVTMANLVSRIPSFSWTSLKMTAKRALFFSTPHSPH